MLKTYKSKGHIKVMELQPVENRNYADFLKRALKGDLYFDCFLGHLVNEMMAYDKINPYIENPLKPLNDKVNAFLQRHVGISYLEFVDQTKPEDFEEEDFEFLPRKKNLRRRLFDFRARLVIAALADTEKQGLNLEEILDAIKDETIPLIKREKEEPTFKAILKILRK